MIVLHRVAVKKTSGVVGGMLQVVGKKHQNLGRIRAFDFHLRVLLIELANKHLVFAFRDQDIIRLKVYWTDGE